jgi:hypothetical protein
MKKKYNDYSEWCLNARVQRLRAGDFDAVLSRIIRATAVISDADRPVICCSGKNRCLMLVLMDMFGEYPEQTFTVGDLTNAINARWPGTIGGKKTGCQTDSTMMHALTKLWLIGVLDRVKYQGDYQYSFSPKVIEVGLETFIFNNSHFVNTVILKGQLGL